MEEDKFWMRIKKNIDYYIQNTLDDEGNVDDIVFDHMNKQLLISLCTNQCALRTGFLLLKNVIKKKTYFL